MGMVSCFRPLHPFTVFKCGEETVSSVFRGCLSDESSHDVRFLIVLMNECVNGDDEWSTMGSNGCGSLFAPTAPFYCF